MGLHSAGGNIILHTITASGSQGAVTFVDTLSAKLSGIGKSVSFLPSAGWEHIGFKKGEISFLAVFFSNGSHIDFITPTDHGGTVTNIFTFTDGTVPGNVMIGATLAITLNNFGTVVHDSLGWSFEVLGTTTLIIHFFDILYTVINDGPPETLDTITNMLFATVTPSGTIGLFDYSPDGVGTGRTHSGGHIVRSAKVSTFATPLTIIISTVSATGFISVAPQDLIQVFDGILSGTWTLLANKYQFFLMVPGEISANGTFLFAGHIYPSLSLTSCNYITGPSFPGNDGNRAGFSGIGNFYYVNAVSPYAGSNSSLVSGNPDICMPGYSYGIAQIDQLGNPLDGIPVIDDLSNPLIYDAFLGAPKIPLVNISILGWIWDALIYTNPLTMDTESAEINNKRAYVVISQAGNRFKTCGSLVVQSEA